MSHQQSKKLRAYLVASHAPNTIRAYETDLRHFREWGGRIPASPTQIACYLAEHAQALSHASLSRRVAAINYAHLVRDLVSPTQADVVKATLRGIRRKEAYQRREVDPLRRKDIVRMLQGVNGLRGLRDKALLLLGFSAALRRSELVALNVEDIRFTREGAMVHIRKSKTDQHANGSWLAIPRVRGRYCPCKALKAWMNTAGSDSGPLFSRLGRYGEIRNTRLSAQSVALIIKDRAMSVGLDPERLSGHSLRAGFATDAAAAGVASFRIRAQTRHGSDAMLNRYIRHRELFREHPVVEIWS